MMPKNERLNYQTLKDIILEMRSGFACGEESAEGVVQFRMHNVSREGSLDWSKLRRIPSELSDSKNLYLKPGDILINCTNSPELVGKSTVFCGYAEPVTYSNHFNRLRVRPAAADPGYVARWLHYQWMSGVFQASCRQWVNQASITKDQIERLVLPLPPLPEQRRIAAILDHADALRAKRRAAIAKLDSLAQSIFLDMFGDPVAPTDLSPLVPVSSFVQSFETGKSLVSEDEEDETSPYRVLKVSAVTSCSFDPSESKAIPLDYVPPSGHFVRKGDLLFTRANTSDLIGATASVFETPENLLLPDKIWRFVWRQPYLVDPMFVWHLFRHPRVRYEITRRSTGTSGSMKNISQEKVLGIKVILPPMDRQKLFGNSIRKMHGVDNNINASRRRIDALFATLQNRAFRGDL